MCETTICASNDAAFQHRAAVRDLGDLTVRDPLADRPAAR
jgi:hypothetical protein